MRGFSLLIVVAIALALTNPSSDAHGQALKQWAMRKCGGGMLSLLCGAVAGLGSTAMDYESYVLFSMGHVEKIRTIGIGTKVFVLSEQ